jgi:hypothetical protein
LHEEHKGRLINSINGNGSSGSTKEQDFAVELYADPLEDIPPPKVLLGLQPEIKPYRKQ